LTSIEEIPIEDCNYYYRHVLCFVLWLCQKKRIACFYFIIPLKGPDLSHP